MGTEQLEYAYAGTILKWEDHPDGDGTILVHGVATDPGEDLDGQGCDPEWLKKAMPEWFKFANIREQHGPVAAGVGKSLTHGDGDSWHLTSHIVDPGTIAKVKSKTLKGYSVGIRNGQVLRGKAAGFRNGKIVGGDIVEVSLVDRPCNPRATISIAKAAGGVGELEAVEPEFIDIDPSLYGEADDVVPSDGDVNGEPGGDESAADSGEPAGGDDDADGDQLSLFDDLDDAGEIGWDDEPAMDKAWSLLDDVADEDDDAEVTISKGLLESLLNGPKPKKDGDGDGKVGENDGAKRRAAEAKRNREHREREAERERRHRGKVDAEALQDANNAQRQGRRQEADEHRGRLGSYRKSLELRDYRAGVKLVGLVLDGVIVKGAALETDEEIVAELCDLVATEADQLAGGGYGGDPEDVSLLLDACAAIAKMAGAGLTIRKAAGVAVDESTAAATLEPAEISKAQTSSEVTKALEAQVRDLSAQVARMAATPIPGGPFVGKFAMPSTPEPTAHITKAIQLEQKAANPALSAEAVAGYLALAAAERAKG